MKRKKRFYAVPVGRKTGIFKSADEAVAQTRGFRNSYFRAFKSHRAALAWLNDEKRKLYTAEQPRAVCFGSAERSNAQSANRGSAVISAAESLEQILLAQGYTLIWTDGSARPETGTATWAFVLQTDRKCCRCSGSVDDCHRKTSSTAEIIAVIEAVRMAIANNGRRLIVFHDFLQLSQWATGNARDISDSARLYTDYLASIKDVEEIRFIKVKAHSGNVMNDLVDSLARGRLRKSVNF